jgi:hypothetical protein
MEELALYIGFEAGYALAPGLVLLRLLRQRRTSIAETLTIAWPLGIAVECGLFILSATTHQHWLFRFYPAVVAIPVVAVAWLHRNRLSSVCKMPLLSVDGSAASMVLLLTISSAVMLYFGLFAVSPLPGATASVSYYPDLVSHMSMAVEILHHWPLKDPAISSLPLRYHILAHVDMAAAARATGVGIPTIALRLQPSLLVIIIGLELFVLGSRVGNGRSTGFLTAVLGLFAGTINLSKINPSLFCGPIGILGNPFSPSYYMGAVFFLALLIIIVPVIGDRALGRHGRGGYWLALLILSLAAAVAKVETLLVLIPGIALFALLRGRTHLKQTMVVGAHLAVISMAFAVVYLVLYRGASGGAMLLPANYLMYSGAWRLYRASSHSLLALVATAGAALVVLCAILLPLGGVTLARDLRRRPRRSSSPERLLMCVLAASLPFFVLLGITGDSQGYFLVYGFLAAVALSAAGLVRFGRALALSMRDLIAPVVFLSGGVLIVVVGLAVDHAHIALIPGYAFAFVVVMVTVRLLRSRLAAVHMTPPSVLSITVAVAVALTLVDLPVHVALPSVERLVRGLPTAEASGIERHRGMTAGLYRGLLWLRAHSSPDDVLAVNNHTIEGGSHLNIARYYYYSAFAERRVFFEAWDQTPEEMRYFLLGRRDTPFPRLLSLNEAAIAHGSLAALEVLYARYGVRYVVVDRRHGPSSPALAHVALRVYSNPDVTIYRVRRPA